MLTDARLLTPRQVGSRLPGSARRHSSVCFMAAARLPIFSDSVVSSGSPPRPVAVLLFQWECQGSETTSASPSMVPVSAALGLLDATFCFICGGQLFSAFMTTSSLSKDAPPSLVPRTPLLPPLCQHTVSLGEIHTALRPVGPAPGGGC